MKFVTDPMICLPYIYIYINFRVYGCVSIVTMPLPAKSLSHSMVFKLLKAVCLVHKKETPAVVFVWRRSFLLSLGQNRKFYGWT